MRSRIFVLLFGLCALGVSTSDGATAQSILHWEGSRGTLELKQVAPNAIQSLDGEYALILEDHAIILETKRGFSDRPVKRIQYAKMHKYSESFGGIAPKTHVYIHVDANNTPLVKAVLHKTNGQEELRVNYIDGSYPLIHIEAHPILQLINESTVAFDEVMTEELSPEYFKSASGKYKILFEDRGWVDFGPPSQKYNPQVAFNPSREWAIWLEIEGSPTSNQKILYAVMTYPFDLMPQDAYGVYEMAMPLTLHLDQEGYLRVASDLLGGEVSYPIGLLSLDDE